MHNAASTSRADVEAVIKLAEIGDTIVIPAGTSVWSSPLLITRGIILQGSGTNATGRTMLINGAANRETPLITMDLAADRPMRITGIHFRDQNLNRDCSAIINDYGRIHETQMRIDHCVFEGFAFSLKMYGAFGVVHNCYFYNTEKVLRTGGYYTSADLNGIASPPWSWGSTNYFVVEDCQITYENWAIDSFACSAEMPSNYMLRYNNFDIHRSSGVGADGFDIHGEEGPGLKDLGMVIYKNTFTFTGNMGVDEMNLADIRGGNGNLVYSNVVKNVKPYIDVRDDPFQSPLMINTHIWGNEPEPSILEANGVREGTHYFLTRPVNFKELQYPHPLRADTGHPSPPQGLRIDP